MFGYYTSFTIGMQLGYAPTIDSAPYTAEFGLPEGVF